MLHAICHRFLLRQRACRLFPLELEALVTSKNKRRSMQRISKNFKITWLYLVSCKDADFESQLADMPYLVPYESEEKMKGSFLKLGILGNYGNVWQSLNLEKRSLFGERDPDKLVADCNCSILTFILSFMFVLGSTLLDR